MNSKQLQRAAISQRHGASRPWLFLWLLLGIGVRGPAAQTVDPVALVRAAEEAIKGKTSHAVLEMTVVTPDYRRTRKLEAWWKGNEKALIVTLAPPREAGNRTLKRGSELWMYLQETETTIKIPPSMMLQSWMGSDFTYDDLVRESNLVRDYHIRQVGTDTLEGVPCYVLELLPKPEAPVVWGKLHYWIRQTDRLPARIEYYSEQGERVRTLSFHNVQRMGGRRLPTRWIMHNDREPGRYTEIRLLEVAFDMPIPEAIFSFRALEQ
ncbi:outer membrane lipoprotein-sorting protein [Rhodothermus profundi]|uniref:Outer membrane lipoprotein-sorting protein n=1 Tax=Rhodothermus profundi TaxID=633813 RepID=A0A1M6TL23_9BACT|nr:outer membrane lipoprotein-sorting protein [Rhodothermus profundi]SHK57586.1 Outer membrane lipoprotein-sorting protein [Rhodothermus profundi]